MKTHALNARGNICVLIEQLLNLSGYDSCIYTLTAMSVSINIIMHNGN